MSWRGNSSRAWQASMSGIASRSKKLRTVAAVMRSSGARRSSIR